MIVAESAYLELVLTDRPEGWKTDVYLIRNRRSGTTLAEIKWYGPWRQYCLEVGDWIPTVWSADCLADVRQWLLTINKGHREGRR